MGPSEVTMRIVLMLVPAALLALAAGGAQAQKASGEIVGGIDFDRAFSCWDLNPISTSKCYRGLSQRIKQGSEKCDQDQCREDARKSIEALECASNAVRKPGPNERKESAQKACLAPLK
jgi:hypothetical protein